MNKNFYTICFASTLLYSMIQPSTLKSPTKSQSSPYRIEFLSNIPPHKKYQQDRIIYVMYPNRFGSTSITEGYNLQDDIHYQLKNIKNKEEKTQYIQKLIEDGFIYERPSSIHKRCTNLAKIHKKAQEYKLF